LVVAWEGKGGMNPPLLKTLMFSHARRSKEVGGYIFYILYINLSGQPPVAPFDVVGMWVLDAHAIDETARMALWLLLSSGDEGHPRGLVDGVRVEDPHPHHVERRHRRLSR
jgi:hypothetical protein